MFTVLDSGKGDIDPERWEDEEMLDSIRHLFITREDNNRPIAEGQDGEQDTIDEEVNPSDVDIYYEDVFSGAWKSLNLEVS